LFVRPIEVARLLGIHESSVYRAIYSGELPALKFRGKVWLIKREDADAWIDQNSEPNIAA
jgi:excisionase family DNA binding protein